MRTTFAGWAAVPQRMEATRRALWMMTMTTGEGPEAAVRVADTCLMMSILFLTPFGECEAFFLLLAEDGKDNRRFDRNRRMCQSSRASLTHNTKERAI